MLTTQPSLIARVADGDLAAWSQFTATYDALVTAYIRKKAIAKGYYHVDNYLADVVQGVWIKLWSTSAGGKLYDRDRGRFRTFLYTVTCNALNDFFRRERRHVDGRRDMPEADQLSVDSSADEAEWDRAYRQAVLADVCRRMREEMMGSNPTRWRCFEQYVLEHRPATEVAGELGISVDLVYQHASRSLRKVREQSLALYEEDITQ